MNAEETKQAAAVMIASETKNIQQRYRHGKSDDGWVDVPDPEWDWDTFDYRIAPEPMEVDVWVHEDGTIVGPATINREHMMKGGYKLRRATIHPEEVKP